MNKQIQGQQQGQEKSSVRSPNDQRSDVKNPTSSDFKADQDNKSNQQNPNNPSYQSSRGTTDSNKNLPKDSEIKSLMQITNEEFARILLKICKRIISIKGIEQNLPEILSKDLNTKYRECQKIVDFIKHLGYKADLHLNNILFPSIRDIQRLFEYTLEYITNVDTGVLDLGENISEKNFAKIKLSKQLSTWSKELWLVPELNYDEESKSKIFNQFIIKSDKNKLFTLKKKIANVIVNIPENLKTISKNKSDELYSMEQVKFITEDELSGFSFSNKNSNSNFIVEKLKKKIKNNNNDKTTNGQFIEILNKRTIGMEFIQKNYHENNFINNLKILEQKNKDGYSKYSISNNEKLENENNLKNEEQNSNNDIQTGKQNYKNKIDSIMLNYENEKEIKHSEIKELNIKIQNMLNLLQIKNQDLEENEIKKEELNFSILDLSNKNEDVIKEIEEKLDTFEQIEKLNNSEIKEDELNTEIINLDKKYDEIISNWEEYSGQAKSRIEELKNSIETKKKEYNFKYEKINFLIKEIDEISTKIFQKSELSNFLNEEYQKIPIDVNRNKFITKISELTGSISLEKKNIFIYITDLKNLEHQISNINDVIKKVDNELEDKLYQDVKSNSALKDLYALFIKIRDGYNVIQKNIIDTQIIKNKLKDVENKVEDYQIKLKSYDINQLQEQVELLKLENSKNK